MYKAFKYKLNPTKQQITELTKWFGCARWIWNWALTTNTQQYQLNKKFVFKFDLTNQLPKLKQDKDWLKDIPAHGLLNRLIDFDVALRRVWKLGAGFPKYKSKLIEHHNTFKINQINKHIKLFDKQIQIPKIGLVKYRYHRPIEGILKSITIKKENDMYWVVCLCDLGDIQPIHPNEDVVGIDLGLKDFAVTSDGVVFATPKLYRKKQKKLKWLQQRLSKKKKGSKNKEKARKKLNRLHYKIKCQRNDFTHKISNQITNDYKYIAIEDLNVKGMIKNHNLAKSIQDQAWSSFTLQLAYKSLYKGGITKKIDRFYPSSKTCSCCGNVQTISLSERIYNCDACEISIDRDLNAAINIKNRAGIAQINACGNTSSGDDVMTSSSYVLMKQEAA